jgi:hypothetical protein
MGMEISKGVRNLRKELIKEFADFLIILLRSLPVLTKSLDSYLDSGLTSEEWGE